MYTVPLPVIVAEKKSSLLRHSTFFDRYSIFDIRCEKQLIAIPDQAGGL